MSDTTTFARRLTQAVERRSKAKQANKPQQTTNDSIIISSNIKTKLNDDEYKKIITTKMIEHIHKHKEAIL